MAYTDDDLNAIYDRISGYCQVCRKKLGFGSYDLLDARGAWEVEHLLPRARAVTDHRNNLFAACIRCNREKGARHTRTARARHGRSRAPLSRQKREEARVGNAIAGGLVSAGLEVPAGPVGPLVGGVPGAMLGYDANPNAD